MDWGKGDLGNLNIGLALASGGTRGSAHVGVLKVLEREGIEISAIAGTSIGGVVGGAYAAAASVERIEQEWLKTDLPRVVRNFLPTFPRAGLSSGNEFRKELHRLLGNVRIEELPIPFAAVGTDIDTGEAVEPLPVRACRALGAELVIGVDIIPALHPTTAPQRSAWNRLGERLREETAGRPWVPAGLTELLADVFKDRHSDERPLPGVYSIINQAAVIFQQEILRLKLTLWPPDVLVKPELPPRINYLNAAVGIRAGEEAMQKAIPQLKSIPKTKPVEKGAK